MYPLDADTLVESTKKTGYAIVIDEGAARYGVTGELASVIQERAFDWLDGPVLRIAGADVPIPFSPVLELPTIPDVDRILSAVRSLRG
jgi:pyruvate dehydrogenase E1 component beta subunit